MMAAAIHERVVAKPKDSLIRDLAVALERMGSGSLVKRQPEFPVAAIAVGGAAAPRRQQRAASHEVGVDELEIEPAPVRIATVRERNLCGGSAAEVGPKVPPAPPGALPPGVAPRL